MTCSHCGHTGSTITLHSLQLTCPLCGADSTGGPLAATRSDNPWESDRASEAPFAALWLTLKNSFAKPVRFFSQTLRRESVLPAFLYALITGSFGTGISAVWNMLLPAAIVSNNNLLKEFFTPVSPATLIATPIIVLAGLFFGAAYTHLMLILTRSRKKKFAVTFKIICYAQGSMLLTAIPFIGPPLSVAAWLYLALYGIGTGHSISKTRAFLTIALPFFLLLAMVTIAALLVVGFAGLLSGSPSDFISLFRN